MFSKNVGFALALIGSMALAACNSGDATGPLAGNPTDTTHKGAPLPDPPKKTCSNDPATGEPCVNGANMAAVGAIDLPDSIGGTIVSIAASSDGQIVANTTAHKVVVLSRTYDGTKAAYAITRIIPVSSTDRRIAVCAGKVYVPLDAIQIQEIDLNSGQILRTLNQNGQMTQSYITSLACSQNGQYLLVGDSTRTVYSYWFASNTFMRFADTTSTVGAAAFAAWNPGATQFVVAGPVYTNGPVKNGTKTLTYPVVFYNTSGSQVQLEDPVNEGSKPIVDVAYGKWPVAISADSTVRVYNPTPVADGKILQLCSKLVNGDPTRVAAAPSTDYYAVGTATGNFAVWKAGQPACNLMYRSDSRIVNGPVMGIRFTTDGTLEISGGGRIVALRFQQ